MHIIFSHSPKSLVHVAADNKHGGWARCSRCFASAPADASRDLAHLSFLPLGFVGPEMTQRVGNLGPSLSAPWVLKR